CNRKVWISTAKSVKTFSPM
ncbi:polar flagellar hook associated type 1 domain protein, partial [Vibrio parahaemolyticus V-223/04]